ncbi:Outer membrane protein TolC [Prosthecobacter debontii]|uniref:Outer membrane protein TolC n=1 Tax=Prosthecobacter debontii TaxID=48467 RepID=A0A1T4WFU5_9BACT|nr:TolC family protein [Prosthecobacter debontii]SKA76029.1 Outer membrane protein TolC [Prosthecobacter debontii]
MRSLTPLDRLQALLCLILLTAVTAYGASREKAQPLLLSEVLASVQTQYPPYLAALIEQDIANGRVRQAQGAFDLNLTAGGNLTLAGYYDGHTGYAMLEQPLPFWGGSIYGGYRLSSGYLPNYNKDRTGSDGESILGFSIPLLRGGTIDSRRANLWKAQIDQELADPLIRRQYLDFVRAASVSYYNWLAAGQRLALHESLLQLAKDRDSAIAEQVSKGASAPIVQVDNQRLVVSREIALVQAQRRFEAASIELSLFYRTASQAEPILAKRDRLPKSFPAHEKLDDNKLTSDIAKAAIFRPEMRRMELLIEKSLVDLKLAKNNMLPQLNAGIEAGQFMGENRPKDLEHNEIQAKIEFKLPLQRREAQGSIAATEALLQRLEQDRKFARDRIAADVRDSYSAVAATEGILMQTRRNMELSRQLEAAEQERLKEGATDLLALQIREQAAFDAQVLEVEAQAEYFRALANYKAAVAADLPPSVNRGSK